jgi:hypothetical protein
MGDEGHEEMSSPEETHTQQHSEEVSEVAEETPEKKDEDVNPEDIPF